MDAVADYGVVALKSQTLQIRHAPIPRSHNSLVECSCLRSREVEPPLQLRAITHTPRLVACRQHEDSSRRFERHERMNHAHEICRQYPPEDCAMPDARAAGGFLIV